jgi:hypothetical protein
MIHVKCGKSMMAFIHAKASIVYRVRSNWCLFVPSLSDLHAAFNVSYVPFKSLQPLELS